MESCETRRGFLFLSSEALLRRIIPSQVVLESRESSAERIDVGGLGQNAGENFVHPTWLAEAH